MVPAGWSPFHQEHPRLPGAAVTRCGPHRHLAATWGSAGPSRVRVLSRGRACHAAAGPLLCQDRCAETSKSHGISEARLLGGPAHQATSRCESCRNWPARGSSKAPSFLMALPGPHHTKRAFPKVDQAWFRSVSRVTVKRTGFQEQVSRKESPTTVRVPDRFRPRAAVAMPHPPPLPQVTGLMSSSAARFQYLCALLSSPVSGSGTLGFFSKHV